MGLLNKVKETFTDSADATKETANEVVETVSEKAEDAVEVTKNNVEKKDNCCGGNCGG